MRNRKLILPALLLLALLGGCSNDDAADLEKPQLDTFALLAAYPYQGMQQVPVRARVHLAFTAPLDQYSADGKLSLVRLLPRGGTENVRCELIKHRESLELRPLAPLRGHAEYGVRLESGLRDFSGRRIGAAEILFSTRPDRPDARNFPIVDLARPVSGDELDISTFRIYFSEPLDPQSVAYGRNVHLRVAEQDKADDDDDDDDAAGDDDDAPAPADEPGELVPARTYVQGNLVVIDPLFDLNPKLKYELRFDADPFEYPAEDDDDDDDDAKAEDDDDDDDAATAGVHDLDDTGLQKPFVRSFYPHSSEPRKQLITEAWPSAAEGSSQAPIDADDVPASVLTGRPVNSLAAMSKMLGDSVLYIAGPLFSELGDAGDFSRIPLTIRAGEFLSTSSMDAKLGGEIPAGLTTGALTLKMITDVSGMLEDSADYVGRTEIRPAVTLVMDIALTAEDVTSNSAMTQQILGTELVGISYVRKSDGQLVLELMGYSEMELAGEKVPSLITMYQVPYPGTPVRRPDKAPPLALATLPQQSSELVPTESPVIVYFNEPPDPATLASVKLYDAAEHEIPCRSYVNGAKVVLRPLDPLEEYTGYAVMVEPGLEDLAGNATKTRWGATFSTNAPGYSNWPPKLGTADIADERGAAYPANLWPTLFFVQVMNPETMWYGDTVQLFDLDAGKLLPATLVADWRRLTVIPAEPLTPQRRYRLVLSDEIRSYKGAQLDTNFDLAPGGGEFWLDFTAAEPSADVELFLSTEPITDTDGNGFFDYEETPVPDNQIEILSELIMAPSYVNGEMVSWVSGLAYDDAGAPYLGIKLSDGIMLYATSTSMGLPIFEGGDDKYPGDPGPLGMGPITINVVEPGDAPVVEGTDGLPQMNISMMTYFTVRNGLINALLQHDLALEQTGRMYFMPDGRMEVLISGSSEIGMLGGLLKLPAAVNMRAVSPPPL